MRVVHDRARAGGVSGGPQRMFDFFHEWLRDSKQKAFGPIRDVTRKYILDHFAIEQGTSVFDEVVTEQRKHTVYTLARKLASQPVRVQRALVYAGLIDGDPTRASQYAIVDAAAAEALFARISTAMSSRKLREYLNCHRMQAEQLIAAGILPQIIDPGDRAPNSKKRVSREDANVLLRDLLGRARRVGKASEGLGEIAKVAHATGWSVVDIVKALIGGRLARVECIDADLRFLGVLVDPTEVRAVLSRGASADCVSGDEAARILGIRRYALSGFLKLRAPGGDAYFRAHSVRNAEGRRTRVFSNSSRGFSMSASG